MSRIDTHIHVTPPVYVEGVKRALGDRPLPMFPSTHEGLLALMERYAIDAAVVSGGPPSVFLGDQGQANELARATNEALAEIVASDPARLAAMAFLPLPDVDAAVAELGHALDALGLDGVFLLTHVGGTYLGDPAWDALFDELDRRGAYAFVHPTMPPHPLPIADHPVWMYEFPHDTTRSIAQLLYSGTLERCPNVRLQFSHLGGTAPFIAHRIASLADREPERASHLGAYPLEYLSRLYYDTGLSNHSPGLAATLEIAPLERIVFGTDWPYAALPEGEDPAPGLDWLGAERRAQVEWANALALVPRLARS